LTHTVDTTQKQYKTQQNKTSLVPSPLTTLGQETRWAYSTTLLSTRSRKKQHTDAALIQ